MYRLNMIGCGRVGKTLGSLWVRTGLVEIGDVLNRSWQSAAAAVAFLGSGRAVERMEEMSPADLHLIASGDDSIGGLAQRLATLTIVRRNDTVFHCSGALSSSVLSPLRSCGAMLGSVHPVRSFTAPESSEAALAGTFCALEGDRQAQPLLTELFTAIGGRVVPIDPGNKRIYHAGAVFACNYLTALLELGFRCCGQAGLDRETSREMLEPLVRETVDNVFRMGPEQSLTGPVARGDSTLVAGQLSDLSEWRPETGEIYRLLGRVALELVQKRGTLPAEALKGLEKVLEGSPAPRAEKG